MDKFTLFWPVKPNSTNQLFGENPLIYAQFGIEGHNGIDFAAYYGQPVRAAHDGIAHLTKDDKEGWGYIIITDKPYAYNSGSSFFKTIYWHLCNDKDPQFAPVVKSGTWVAAGTLLGYAGNTGFVFPEPTPANPHAGTHLHFGLKPVLLGESLWSWYNVEQNNGFKGSIDPTPFFNKFYAEDAQKLFGLYASIISLLQKLVAAKP